MFWHSRSDGEREAEDLMLRAPGLSMLLKVLDTEDFQFPEAEILRKPKEKGASKSVAVYCGLAEILRKPPSKSTQTEDFKRWADRLRRRKEVSYAESSAEASDPTDLDFEYDEFNTIEEQAACIVDEAETNDTAVAFIRMIHMAVQEFQNTTNRKPFPAVKPFSGEIPQNSDNLRNLYLIVVKAFSSPTIWSQVVVIAKIEVKRHEGIHILPQHLSQLNAQMYRIALEYKWSTTARDYRNIPKTDRTAKWLHALFGPFSNLGVSAPRERKTRLGFQVFRVNAPYLLDTADGRMDAACIILWIAFCVVRIGCNYKEVADYTK
ncbi:hypothetical protein C0995_008802 [Termitomyces sp. Mi166|nr:hypothetical protein C0995_008802 [Termitomyces sp. Mi166\